MFACICHAVSESEVRGLVADGVDDVDLLGEITGAGTGCGTCLDRLESLVSCGSHQGLAAAAAGSGGHRHEQAPCPRLDLVGLHRRP